MQKVPKSRIFSAIILAPLLVLAILYLNTHWLALMLGLVICIAAWEWARMINMRSSTSGILYVGLVCILLGLAYYLLDSKGAWLVVLGAVFWWIFALFLVIAVQRQMLEMTKSRYYKALMGLFVLIPTWLSMVMLHHRGQQGVILLVFLCVLVWIADISAYFAGRKWGERKLSVRISPGKSWEGVYGAIIATFVEIHRGRSRRARCL